MGVRDYRRTLLPHAGTRGWRRASLSERAISRSGDATGLFATCSTWQNTLTGNDPASPSNPPPTPPLPSSPLLLLGLFLLGNK